jgi:hypothetical protein
MNHRSAWGLMACLSEEWGHQRYHPDRVPLIGGSILRKKDSQGGPVNFSMAFTVVRDYKETKGIPSSGPSELFRYSSTPSFGMAMAVYTGLDRPSLPELYEKPIQFYTDNENIGGAFSVIQDVLKQTMQQPPIIAAAGMSTSGPIGSDPGCYHIAPVRLLHS